MPRDTSAQPARARAQCFKTERKVLLVVLIFILILEGFSRYLAPNLDSSRKHIFEFPKIAESIANVPNECESVLILGNSLMMHGVEIQQLRAEIRQEKNISIAKITPVSTTVVDWTYLYKKFFEDAHVHPDLIFVGFVRHHIADANQAYPIQNRRLGRHFLASADQWDLWTNELPDLHDKIQTSLAHYSSLVGDQPEHQYHIFRAMIPSYGKGLAINNDWVDAWNKKRMEQRQEINRSQIKAVTYRRLEKFLEMMKQNGVKVIMVPMPQPQFYHLDPAIKETVEAKGGIWLDARKLCLASEYYSDGYHLGEKGIPIFTSWMASMIDSYKMK